MGRRHASVFVAMLLVSQSFGLRAQSSSSRPIARAGDVQEQNRQILEELRAIRQLLERMAAPQPSPPQRAVVTGLSEFALGRSDAPMTMVEFTDLQCPFCREYGVNVFDEIKKNWIDTGKVRYVARDLPLEMHPQARTAARAARCAGEQGKFWEMHTRLMRNANLLSPDYISKAADELELQRAPFVSCLASQRQEEAIERSIADALQAGIRGTPTFVLGKTTGDRLDGTVIVGAQPYTVFAAKLKELLAADDAPTR
jgi:protein-disulfide isomerase